MQIWCMAHPWMTLFLATLAILAFVDISGNIAIGIANRKRKTNDEKGEGKE